MNQVEFYRLVKKDKYQVFLMASRCPMPFVFALHTWFVLNKKGEIDRWEAGQFNRPNFQ